MDYSIGSLADLISGSNTPNKSKVLIKQIKKSPKIEVESHNQEDNEGEEISQENVKNKKKKVKNLNFQPDTSMDMNETSLFVNGKKKKVKKNKLKKVTPETDISTEIDDTLPPIDRLGSKKRKLSLPVNDVLPEEDSEKRSNKKVKKLRVLIPDEDGEETGSLKKSVNDVNAEKRIKKKAKQVRLEDVFPAEENRRTLFVGNVPITINKTKLTRFFSKYGKVEAVRFRGVPVADPKTPKKVAIIKKEFHPERSSYLAFVRFQTREEATKALEANGTLFKNHHLRCHLSDDKEKPDEAKAIFVGNLSFNVEDEELWEIFQPCGEIDTVRIVRDARTGMGKGFAYVNFKSSDSVQIALEMENVTLKNRELRISLCNINAAKKNKKLNKSKQITQAGKAKPRRFWNNRKPGAGQNNSAKETAPSNINADYQGSKFTGKKKKNKPNKGLLQKKQMIRKLAPKAT